MKMSRACSGTLSSEMMISNSLKLRKHKMYVHYVHHSSRAHGTVLSLQTSLSLTRNMCNGSQRAVLYIFQNIEISMLVTFH